MLATYGFHLGRPWWLLIVLLLVPAIWLGVRSLRTLGPVRRGLAVGLRALVVGLLAFALARPMLTRTDDKLTVLMVLDRSQSVPPALRRAAHAYLSKVLEDKPAGDQLAVIDVAEAVSIARLPSTATDVPERNLALDGRESRLAAGVQMAMAVAPPNTSVRILLISDGNETAGDLKAAARVAAANRIPIDVVPLHYKHDREVVFRRLSAPTRARSGQTVTLRFVLNSTHEAAGQLMLTLNGRPVDLDPTSAGTTVPVRLKAGTTSHSVSLPVGTRGVHEFEARFLPEDDQQDKLPENNRASAVTFVAGPGHVLVASADAREAAPLVQALRDAKIDVRALPVGELPTNLTGLLGTDALVLVNTDVSHFSMGQQEMLCRYVADLGGGLVTVGGPDSYGAGGWIGSPVAHILPVDMDPPQKKQMPKGALVLIMHACEMPQGNYWGKNVAIAAVRTLSRRDLVGVLDYSWRPGGANWVYPLSPVGDRKTPIARIRQMQMGDMPDFDSPVRAAYQALTKVRAGQKHVIIISDGDPGAPRKDILKAMKDAGITCTGVAVFPHSQNDVRSLQIIAAATGGRFYQPKNANQLPKIFIKEAQVVRRSLIIEDSFTPRINDATSEILRGVRVLPKLDGRVLTGRKGGFSRVLLSSPDGDPVLAATQAGLGRCVSFTSSADSRWASSWLNWGGYSRLWEQAIRWVGKSPQASDCEVFADVQGRNVTLTVEAVNPEGKFVQFANLAGQVIDPKMSSQRLDLRQRGPGRYFAEFRAAKGGSYLVNLRYGRAGEEGVSMVQSVVTVPFAPEFEDLTDNAALLTELARTTGGRVLPGEPEQADLFNRAKLEPPKAAMPLTKPLFIAWVVLFLLDVAVRRIAIDVRAIARRLEAALSGRPKPAESETLAALKRRRKSLRERLRPGEAGEAAAAASRRFEAAAGASTELPQADLSPPPEKTRPEPASAPEAAPEQTHVGRLLDAKRRAAERRKES